METDQPPGDERSLQWGPMVTSTVDRCAAALRPYVDRDWRAVRGRDLTWSVWDTMAHVNDDLYFYAAQIMLADEHDYICFELKPDDHADPARTLAALAVNGRLLAAAADTGDPYSLAHHVYGASDAAGFAAMGVAEALIHTYDAVLGLDPRATWSPPDDLADPVLRRLFPTSPTDRAGDELLHACGRFELVGRPRLTEWRWEGAPRR